MAGILVTALESPADVAAERARLYPVRLGPLRFTCLIGDTPEALGDKLEAVGASLMAGERAPRAAQIVLPVRGSDHELDGYATGFALRRQVRALLNNAAWRPHGLYFEPAWDPDARAWLVVGGGDLTEDDRGPTFGDWKLTLSDAYLIGRPATHRRGRRTTVVDRAAGTVALDTRKLLRSTDLVAVAPAPPEPAIPGDVVAVTGYRDREPTLTAGPVVAGRTLWRTVAAPIDSEILTWRPGPATVTLPDREAAAEDPGTVRVWVTAGDVWAGTAAGDREPDRAYGWERVLGALHDHDAPLAVDNGSCRIVWRGELGLQIELAQVDGRYVPIARVLNHVGTPDASVVEVTAERAVVAWRVGGYEMRAELRRGWRAPRLEAYAPTGGALAGIVIAAPGGTRAAAGTLADTFTTDAVSIAAALSHAAVTWYPPASDTLPDADGGWAAPRVMALQLDAVLGGGPLPPARALALARWDVRSTPTLTER